MSKITTAINLLKHKRGEFFASILTYFNFLFPDKLYLSLLFRLKMGYWMDWNNPKTFSEKLQWLKFYDRKPEYTTMVDKYAVKEYVAKIIGEEYIIPTLGVWDRPEYIDWDKLPQKFVLKTTHGGGGSGVVICKDKTTFDKNDAIKKLKKSLNECIYKSLREWPYKDVDRKIIAETFLEDTFSHTSDYDLKDYKFFCFNGQPEFCQVISGRSNEMCVDFYNMEWSHQPFHEPKDYPFSVIEHDKPFCINEMSRMASILSKGFSFLRVDFYEIENKVYFGELTFFPTSGYGGFNPNEWDYKFGEMIKLPFDN
ncbi:MAG: hypothetical protein J6R59_03535 [Paludibacteraceae bacterium]|nr:hypothetical protein [Paludibacteraceae bacterium]